MHFMAVKKTRTRSGFLVNSHFKDSTSPRQQLKGWKDLNCVLLIFSVTPFKIDQNKKSKPFNSSSQESGK